METDLKEEKIKKIAVIVAGGKGTRMKLEVPKQFLLIRGKPILYFTIRSFLVAFDEIEIILVLPDEYIEKGREIVDGFFDSSRIKLCAGGRTRFHSVQNGLSLIGNEESIIFVHDGVRCLTSKELLAKCYTEALRTGSAIPVIPCNDSVRIITKKGNEVVDRNYLRLVQTPQTFHSKILLPAYNIDYKENFTDEATVVEAFGISVHLVEGDSGNIKITSPVDLKLAEALLFEQSQNEG
jgi:2-C-methyl-D-erythritol 4-phosphate cytidylyltransferase